MVEVGWGDLEGCVRLRKEARNESFQPSRGGKAQKQYSVKEEEAHGMGTRQINAKRQLCSSRKRARSSSTGFWADFARQLSFGGNSS